MTAVEHGWSAAAVLVIAGCLAGCVDVPEPVDRDAVPAVEPGDGPVDGREPPVDLGVDVGRVQPSDSALDAEMMIDRGGAPIRDAEPTDPDAAVEACPPGSVEAAVLGLCLRVSNCTALPEPRIGHRMAVLGSGRVLVVGGGSSPIEGTALAAGTWLFDPATELWHDTGELGTALYRHSVTAMSGERAMVVGGDLEPGEPAGDPQHDTYLIDLSAGLDADWQEPGDTRDRHARHAAAWFGERLMVSGGLDNSRIFGEHSFGDTEIWTDGSGWDADSGGEPPLLDHQIRIGADGTPLLFGGQVLGEQQQPVPNGEVFAWIDGEWQPALADVFHTSGPAVATPTGVLLVGGLPARLSSRRRLTRRALVELAGMAVVRREPAAARLGSGSLVVTLGGEIADAVDTTIDLIDVATGASDTIRLADASIGRWTRARAVSLLDGDALFVGGESGLAATGRCLRIGLALP